MRNIAKNQARQRLARMEGQMRGLLCMIEEERDCVEILTQVASVRAALEGFGTLVLAEHLEEVIQSPDGSPPDPGARARVEHFREALARLVK